MAKYLWIVSYTEAGAQGLLTEGGTKRRTTVDHLVKAAGGTLEAFYYAFGGDDCYVIADLPDDESAAAISLVVAASGGARLKTITLLTPKQMDDAAKRSVDYRPPGA